MLSENEILMLLLGLGVLVFMLINRVNLNRIPSFKILITAYCVFLTAWTLTVLESFFWEAILNFLEHICYFAGAIFMTIWLWIIFGQTKEHG